MTQATSTDRIRKNLFIPTNISIGDMLGNGKKYIVPKYQRNYSWEQEQWQELWDDIKKCYEDENYYHFLGNIVLSEQIGRKEFEIIDGQQRLASISIVAIVLIDFLQQLVNESISKDENQKRVSYYKERLISSTDGTTLYSYPKLQLNKNNNDYYKDYLSQINIVRPSDNNSKPLYDSIIFFKKRLNEDYPNVIKDGEQISKILESIIDKLFLIQITVANENDAYILFECLNARGLDLSPADLIKNYIFSQIRTPHDADIISSKWQELEGITKANKLASFIRYFHNCTEAGVIKEKQLFLELQNIIKETYHGNIDKFINQLIEYAKIYRALKNYTDDEWHKEGGQDIKNAVRVLTDLGVQQPLIVLMPAYQKFKTRDFIQTIKYLSIVAIRYNIVCHKNPNAQESLYNKIAIDIHAGKIKGSSDIKDRVIKGGIYPNDNEFKASFQTLSITKTKVIIYFLKELENYISGNNRGTADTAGTIEHILPESWNENWADFFDTKQHEEYYKKFGNYCLLEAEINSSNEMADIKTFSEKKAGYKKSNYALAKQLLKYDEWNEDSINTRQENLAEQAIKIWSFDNIDNL
ncbi:MAG: DUF262 domain-containing HNH endonuclease family protein [Hydrotalea sp.]|nr:DUF262 domain-containing HNH endonuclease family protein [Hydrotalea sp.]